jgi:hypothetical protein
MISQPYLFHYPITHHHVQKIYRYSSHLFNHAMDITLWCNIWILQIPYDDSCRCHHSSILVIFLHHQILRWCQFAPPTNNLFNLQLLFIIFNGCEWFECQAKFVISFFQSCSSWIMIQVSTNLLFGCASSICHE